MENYRSRNLASETELNKKRAEHRIRGEHGPIAGSEQSRSQDSEAGDRACAEREGEAGAIPCSKRTSKIGRTLVRGKRKSNPEWCWRRQESDPGRVRSPEAADRTYERHWSRGGA